MAKFQSEEELEILQSTSNVYEITPIAFHTAIERYTVWHYVCAKLYKKAFLGEVRFDMRLRFGEDAFFNLSLCAGHSSVSKAYFIDQPLYFYYQRGDSAVHSSSYLDVRKRIEIYVGAFEDNNLNAFGRAIFAKAIVKDLFSFRYLSMFEGNRKHSKALVRKHFPVVYGFLKKEKVLSKKERIIFTAFYHIPLLYRLFRIMGDKTMIAWERESKRRAKQTKAVV